MNGEQLWRNNRNLDENVAHRLLFQFGHTILIWKFIHRNRYVRCGLSCTACVCRGWKEGLAVGLSRSAGGMNNFKNGSCCERVARGNVCGTTMERHLVVKVAG